MIFRSLCIVVFLSALAFSVAAPKGTWKLFGYGTNAYGNSGYGNSGYGNQNTGYYYPQRPRNNRGRQYHGDGGGERYKSICRIHAVDSLAFPGAVGNPVCP